MGTRSGFCLFFFNLGGFMIRQFLKAEGRQIVGRVIAGLIVTTIYFMMTHCGGTQ